MQVWLEVVLESGKRYHAVKYRKFGIQYRYFWIIHIANTGIWTYTGIPDISGISILSKTNLVAWWIFLVNRKSYIMVLFMEMYGSCLTVN